MEIFGKEFDCGCAGRQEYLNARHPGLGDKVKEGISVMGDLLRPDMKSLVWLAIGALVVPWVMKKVNL